VQQLTIVSMVMSYVTSTIVALPKYYNAILHPNTLLLIDNTTGYCKQGHCTI